MESSSLFNPGFLGGSFLWWVGQIADDSTWRDNIISGKFESSDSIVGWGRRYKVRIIGLHDKGEESIPSDQLPWAQVMYPITAGGGQTESSQTPNLRQGNFVFGFFLDGQDQQVPVIMGVLGNNSQTELNLNIGNTEANFSPTSGYSIGVEAPKGSAIPIVPDEGLVVTKPKPKDQSLECSTASLGSGSNKFGLRQDSYLTDKQIADIQFYGAEADSFGLSGARRDQYIKTKLKESSGERCKEYNSYKAPPYPGATRENADAVHEISAADVKRDDKYREKIVFLKPDNNIESALRAIQTILDNLTQKINKYINSLYSYIDAVTITFSDIDKVFNDIACEIAKYLKIILNKIMEYVLKLLNKEMSKVVSAVPLAMRYLLCDVKEVITELLMCLYNKLIETLCDSIYSILKDAFKISEYEELVKNDPYRKVTPNAPMCYAESIVGDVISFNKKEIEDANNSVLNNMNLLLKDMQKELVGAGESVSEFSSLIKGISGNISSALSFENLKFNIFGCELTPNVSVSDYYTLLNGGSAQADSNVPIFKSVEKFSENKKRITPRNKVPFAEPSKNQGIVNSP